MIFYTHGSLSLLDSEAARLRMFLFSRLSAFDFFLIYNKEMTTLVDYPEGKLGRIAIAVAPSKVTPNSAQPEGENRNIAILNQTHQDQLQAKDTTITGLESQISQLKSEVSDKDAKISTLTAKVSDLQKVCQHRNSC